MIEIILLINMLRSQPLVGDMTLTVQAYTRAEQIYKGENVQWDANLMNCAVRGENSAQNLSNADVVRAMTNSPEHKANLVDWRYNRVGVGQYKNITTLVFCN